MPQAQTGKTKSTPKVVRVNADDENAVLYRNLGNGRRLPFMWGTTVTLASGTTEVVVSSGVSFNDHNVSAGIIQVTPLSVSAAHREYYIEKDTVLNQVKLKVNESTSSVDNDYDIMIMLGTGYDFLSTHTNQIWRRSFSN